VRNGEYGLGVDIGDGTVTAAVCRTDGDLEVATALPLGDAGPGSVGPRGEAPRVEVARQVMARVGTPDRLYVDGRWIHPGDAVAAVVARVREVATAQEGCPPARTVLAVPPSWGPHRRACLMESLAATCPDVSLLSSAVAATHHHVASTALPQRGTVAVYDLGASTLDTAVVGPADDGGLRHLAVPPPPLPWGGRDIDDALLAHVLRGVERPTDGDAPVAFPVGLRERVVAAKEALAADTVACVDLPLPTGPVRVTRDELEDLLDRRIEESVVRVAAAITGAGLGADDVDGVVLAGGSVRLPLVAERLSAGLGLPVVVDPEPELTVALGAARLAAAAVPVADERAGIAGITRSGHALPSSGEAAATALVRAAAPRPARSPAGSPRGAPRPPRGTSGRHGSRRVVIVAAMFLGLVGVTSSLIAVVSDVRTAPAAQGQTPAADPAAVPPATAEPAGEVAPSVSSGAAATSTRAGSSRQAVAKPSAPATTSAGAAATSATTPAASPTAAGSTAPPPAATTTPPSTVPPPVVTTPDTTTPVPTTPDPTTPVPTTPAPTPQTTEAPSPVVTAEDPPPPPEPSEASSTGTDGTAP
jgi:molecular chaperone DnaK